jgi:hypothetical protein
MNIADPDHSVKVRIGENIVVWDEFDIGVTADRHVIGDRDIGLGKDDHRH